ncbi:Kinesin-like protein KIN-12B isoform B [Glycine soja]|uniref:Kinesin-like protein KIN-12B isoform A n=1 Tax=Glycine soja TaxID=3848 RepID=A0A445J155_GLYSO|nr:Kinesin-like protein KIN-12B isoform A [Glycine soja]RZB92124.1 Kinesin-like protein KIN-12B isoform B [Glycine soja]
MKRFMLPRNPFSDAAELPSSPSPTPTTSFAKLRPSSHKHKPSKENDLPSDPNLVTPSPAKLKSPLPPRPPSSNPLKRKLTIVDALTDNSLRFRHQGYCQDEAIVFGQGRRRSHSSEDCGKTYTMWGPANCLSHENDQQGLAPRVFQQLFARISEEQTKHSENQLSYQCHCSFLEVDCLLIVSFCVPDLLNNFSLVLLAQSLFLQIYNEPIMDLLDPNQKNLQCWFLCARMEQGTYPPWAHGPGYVVSVDITRTMSKKFRHNHLKIYILKSLMMQTFWRIVELTIP